VFQGVPIKVGVLELTGGRLVDHGRDVRMELEDRCGTARSERTFDGRCDGLRLVAAGRDAHEVSCLADGSERLGDDVAGHLVDARLMLAKNRALSRRVCSVSVLTLVRDPNDDPGSLNPMCPLAPMPRS
jgi:hypothetical protein